MVVARGVITSTVSSLMKTFPIPIVRRRTPSILCTRIMFVVLQLHITHVIAVNRHRLE